MTDYLDKGAVLKAISKGTWAFPPYTLANFFEQLQCGEFDAIPAGSALVSSCLADKDAKIAALQKRCDNDRELATTHLKMIEEKNIEIAQLKNQSDNYHEAIEVLRESKDKEITRRNEIIRRTAHCHGELQREMFKQRARIAEQDQELADLGKALQEAGGLWVCPYVGSCNDPNCRHCMPHFKINECSFFCTKRRSHVVCIPYKKEPTVPQQPVPLPNTDLNYLSARMLKIERQQAPKLGDWDVQPHLSTLTTEILKIKDRLDTLEESRKRIEDLSARMMELEQHQGRDRGDLMTEIRGLIKSTGELEIRLDNAEAAIRKVQENKT